jgi:hypothetical protein
LILGVIQESRARGWTPEATAKKIMDMMHEKCPHVKDHCSHEKTQCCKKDCDRQG